MGEVQQVCSGLPRTFLAPDTMMLPDEEKDLQVMLSIRGPEVKGRGAAVGQPGKADLRLTPDQEGRRHARLAEQELARRQRRQFIDQLDLDGRRRAQILARRAPQVLLAGRAPEAGTG